MKQLILVLLAFPLFCIAQQDNHTAPKPALDDCPSWNKKSKSSGKAEYFNFLRTNKAKDQLQVSQYPNTPQKAYPSKTVVRYIPEEDPFLVPRKARRTEQTAAAKNIIETPRPTESISKKEPLDNREEKETTTITRDEPVAADDAPAEENEEGKTTGIDKEAGAAGTQPFLKEKTIFKKKNSTKSGAIRLPKQKIKTCKPGDASKCPDF